MRFDKTLFEKKVIDSFICLFRNREEMAVHDFFITDMLEVGGGALNVLFRIMIDRHFKLSDEEKIVDTLSINITTNVILAAQEIIPRKTGKKGGTLSLIAQETQGLLIR